MKVAKKNQPCPHCGRFNTRALTIDAVVIKENKLLLIKRAKDPFKDYWATPGGYVEFNETVEESVKRELKEETVLVATKLKLIGVYSLPQRHPKQAIAIAYLVEAHGSPKPADDAQEVRWFSLGKLPSNLAFDHRRIIADAQKLI